MDSRVDRISDLPHEILETILRNVPEKRHLNTVCRVSRLFHGLATPLLYECLEIKCPEGFNPRLTTLKRFSAEWPRAGFTPGLQHVRDLALTTNFENSVQIGERCWHYRLRDEKGDKEHAFPRPPERSRYNPVAESPSEEDGEGNSGEEIDGECVWGCCSGEAECDGNVEPDFCEEHLRDFLEDHFLEDHFRDFCSRLSENGLRSFRWELGACVPQNMLGPEGYLTRHQANIEKLLLVTNGACDVNMDCGVSFDLAKFGRLRDFAWIGPRSGKDFDAIRVCFVTNARHFEALRLDLVDWSKAGDPWFMGDARSSDDPGRRDKSFAQYISSLCRNSSFPVLQSLHLGRFPFRSAVGDLAAAFNVSKLKRLVIWNCPGTTELLEHLTRSQEGLQLVSLEITCGYDGSDDCWSVEFALPLFLQKVAGLETLCLGLPTVDWGDIADSVCRHRGTLERVALHARSIDIEHDSPYYLLEEDQPLNFYPGIYDLFTNGVCDVVAFQNTPGFVRTRLEPHAGEVKCRLLHIRASEDSLVRRGCEIYPTHYEADDFADWVFGPQGFPQLLVFAYGDFAFDKSCRDFNVLYCRNNSIGEGGDGPHYEILTPVNKELWDWVQDNMDVLSACPYRSLLEARDDFF